MLEGGKSRGNTSGGIRDLCNVGAFPSNSALLVFYCKLSHCGFSLTYFLLLAGVWWGVTCIKKNMLTYFFYLFFYFFIIIIIIQVQLHWRTLF